MLGGGGRSQDGRQWREGEAQSSAVRSPDLADCWFNVRHRLTCWRLRKGPPGSEPDSGLNGPACLLYSTVVPVHSGISLCNWNKRTQLFFYVRGRSFPPPGQCFPRRAPGATQGFRSAFEINRIPSVCHPDEVPGGGRAGGGWQTVTFPVSVPSENTFQGKYHTC